MNIGTRSPKMTFSKLCSYSIVLAATLMCNNIPINHAWAGSPLDQPPILTASALHDVAKFNKEIPDHIAISKDGRMFVLFPHYVENTTLSLAIRNSDNSLQPYPDATWNQQNSNKTDKKNYFFAPTSMTITSDEFLWVLDSGVKQLGSSANYDHVKLIKIDLKTNQVAKIFNIDRTVLTSKSLLTAISIHGNHAYIADAGAPALIVMNLETGSGRRVLENSATLYARQAVIVDGKIIKPASDNSVLPNTTQEALFSLLNVNQLAISPDGRWLYYQTASGPLYRIDTYLLNDASLTPVELSEGMTLWYKTRSAGGIACGPDGSLYITDIATNSIYRFTTGRILTKLITDKRLQWPSHPFVSNKNILYIPATQLDKALYTTKPVITDQSHHAVQWPVEIFSLNIPNANP